MCVNALMPGGGDDVALGEGPPFEAAAQRLGRTLQPNIVLRRREYHAGGRFRHGLANFDEIARPDPGVDPLQPVEANDVEPFVVAVRADRARRG